MAMQRATHDFLQFLRDHPEIRDRIRAPRNRTLLYSGAFFKEMWEEVKELRERKPEARDKVTLLDALQQIPLEEGPLPTLLDWIRSLEELEPHRHNGLAAWRMVSCIFASNAVGKVSFQVGSGVSREAKIFARTELAALARNPNLHPLTQEMLGYFQDNLDAGSDPKVGFIADSTDDEITPVPVRRLPPSARRRLRR